VNKLFLLFILSFPFSISAQNFQWIKLNLGDECRDNSNARNEILNYLTANTSITANHAKKEIKILSIMICLNNPFIALSCKSAPRTLSFTEVLKLRKYLMHGGTLFINNRFARKGEGFDNWVKKTTDILFLKIL